MNDREARMKGTERIIIMMGSMYSAVSGLKAHQTKMNVIGNNIANVNTYGFKSSRVTFSDVFYQTIQGASTSSKDTGGTNPTQLGYGAKVNSIDVINTIAGSATTDRALDIYINGDGYLPVQANDGTVQYTRVGVLSFDASGNLVDTNGNMVLGLDFNDTTGVNKLGADGTVSAEDLIPINVNVEDLDEYTGIAIGQYGEITGIKEGDPTIVKATDTGWLTTATLTAASLYNGTITMSNTRSATVALSEGTYEDGTTISSSAISVPTTANINGELVLNYDSTAAPGSEYTLSYTKKDGTAVSGVAGTMSGSTLTFAVDTDTTPVSTANLTVDVGTTAASQVVWPSGAASLSLGNVVASSMTVNVSAYDKSGAEIALTGTWTEGQTSMTLGNMTLTLDATKFGTLEDGELDDTIIGTAGAGTSKTVKIGNLAIAKFTNADGLSQSGEGYFAATNNSGEAVATVPGSEGTGTLLSGSLEMSNVDLSREFTEMIIAQRGFQANTKMITVSDEMLSELVGMKR